MLFVSTISTCARLPFVKRAFKKALKLAQLPSFRVYDLRHPEDAVKKLYERPSGFMVGAGEHVLIDAVGTAFENENESLRNLEQLNELISSAYDSVAKASGEEEWFDVAMDRTSIFFSFVMDGQVRVVMYSGARDRRRLSGQIPPRDAFVVAPFGSADGLDAALQKLLRRYIKPVDEHEGLIAAARHDVELVGRTLAEVSKRSQFVSACGTRAVHFVNGTKFVRPFSAHEFATSTEELEAVFAAA